MSLQIVAGKPGSGKSYHTVMMLLQQLEDWVLFERKEERAFERVLYTNLPLQELPINDYLAKRIGGDVDVSHYVRQIDDDVRNQFLNSRGKVDKDGKPLFPLAGLPQGSMIVIDEVQKMFGSEMDTDRAAKDFNVSFRNYISQHRHYGHDLIFITQHTDNISKAILAMAEKLYEVSNAKSLSFPFPINIPFSDIDVIKEAFGVKNQFYRVSVGKYVGRRVRFDGEATSHLMTQEVFACYQSHTLSDVTSDRPSLNLSRVGAIVWFVRKHGWHLFLKLVVAVLALYFGLHFIRNLPNIVVQALSSSLTPAAIQPVSSQDKSGVTSPASSSGVTTPIMEPPYPALPGAPGMYGGEFGPPRRFVPVSDCGDPGCVADHTLPKVRPNEKITAVFVQGVITDKGRRRIGQLVMIDGTEEIIKTINVRRGVVIFESGKEVTVPQ